jgi:hypothetical protein
LSRITFFGNIVSKGGSWGEDRLVPTLEQMARPLMVFIEKLSIDPVQLAHAPGEIAVRCLDQEVIVVVHQAIGMTEPIIPFIDVVERIQEVDAVTGRL